MSERKIPLGPVDSPARPAVGVAEPAPLVSVGLPVCNGEEFLRQAVESLLAQEFTDFELIISDNGSTDATEAICRGFVERDSRVRYFREPVNHGAAWNFRRVWDLARGRYFRWACYDDLCTPGHLAVLVDALEQSPPSVILAYTRSIHVNERGEPTEIEEMERLDTVGLRPHERVERVAQRIRHSSILYGLIRRDRLGETDLLGPYQGSDVTLCADLALRGQFLELPEFFFFKRIHPRISRRAATTQEAVARWFDTSRGQRFYFPEIRLVWELARVIRRAPIDGDEKLRSGWVLLRHWVRRRWRHIVKELLAPAVPAFRRYA